MLVESRACERTCLTRNYTEDECTGKMIKKRNTCSCAGGYVRHDGSCIKANGCPNMCHDDENGNVREYT